LPRVSKVLNPKNVVRKLPKIWNKQLKRKQPKIEHNNEKPDNVANSFTTSNFFTVLYKDTFYELKNALSKLADLENVQDVVHVLLRFGVLGLDQPREDDEAVTFDRNLVVLKFGHRRRFRISRSWVLIRLRWTRKT
jgi:hypothetical protein